MYNLIEIYSIMFFIQKIKPLCLLDGRNSTPRFALPDLSYEILYISTQYIFIKGTKTDVSTRFTPKRMYVNGNGSNAFLSEVLVIYKKVLANVYDIILFLYQSSSLFTLYNRLSASKFFGFLGWFFLQFIFRKLV